MSLPIKIKLPEDFLKKEVRCGYEVSEKLKKIWAVELDLLAEFDRVCTKHGIKYQVFAGTLLGAVRHKGFIPWDDDVDVCLLRSEYEKLLNVSHEFKHPYFLQSPYNDTLFFSTHARLRNSETTGAVEGQMDVRYNNGIYIDVFVLDCYTEESRCYKLQKRAVQIITTLLCSKKNYFPASEFWMKRILRRLAKYLLYLVPYSTMLNIRDKVVKFYNSGAASENDNDRISLVTHVNWFTERYWMIRGESLRSRKYTFENIQVWGPVDFDAVLKRPYGDYMSFPPVEQRGKWHEGKIVFDPEVSYINFIGKR